MDNGRLGILDSMTDREIFETFQGPEHRLGEFCYIQVSKPGSMNACKYYVKAKPSTISRYKGWPRTHWQDGDRGTGCVKDSAGFFCYFRDTAYDLTADERDAMCTSQLASNAAAQLKHALLHGACGNITVESSSSSSSPTTPMLSMENIVRDGEVMTALMIARAVVVVVILFLGIMTVSWTRRLRFDRFQKYQRLYRKRVWYEKLLMNHHDRTKSCNDSSRK